MDPKDYDDKKEFSTYEQIKASGPQRKSAILCTNPLGEQLLLGYEHLRPKGESPNQRKGPTLKEQLAQIDSLADKIVK